MSNRKDLLRILISTDNHLGVWEKDEIRKDDSFVSLEEVFEIAAQQSVDLVLLGGDLFHDNKPSRHTVVRVMDILSRHCLSDRPVGFQVLSDQAQNFVNGRVNFENPNYNIGLPVFTIHGNHDDPAGAENLSAVDILSSCNLVNYFGKIAISGSGVGKVRISPVLLRKGDTKLALYGLGNLRDERLARLFQTPGCVEWVRPAETPDIARDDWFSLFVLHQNRVVHSQNAKNNVRESYLARFLDLIVWGHEHECLADPWESAESGGAFSVMQPGSSVATALSEGEARRKHVVMLEVVGQQWRTIKFPLETVRPFVFESVALADVRPQLDPEKPEGVTTYLEGRVQEMIGKAERDRNPRTPPLPLVRLRVDYTGFSTINTQRFGQKFVGKVANPHDMILWQKAAKRREKDAELADAPLDLIRPEALDEARIEDLIAQHLTHNLEILPENDLSIALHEFVDKDNKTALLDAVTHVLKETQSAAVRDERSTQAEQDADLVGVISAVTRQRQASQANASMLQRAEEGQQTSIKKQPPQRATAANGNTSAGGGIDIEDSDGEDHLTEPGPGSRSKGGAPRGGSVTPGRGAKTGSRPPKVPAAAGGSRGRQIKMEPSLGGLGRTALALEPTGQPSQRGGRAMSEGLLSEGLPTKRLASTRAAAGKAQQKMARYKTQVVSDDNDSGDEVNEEELLQELEEVAGGSEEELKKEPPGTGQKRGRRSVGPSASKPPPAKRKVAAAPLPKLAEPTAVGLVDSEDEPDVVSAPRRRMAATAGRTSQRQLPFGTFGTSSQQVSKGWGSVR